MFKVQTTAGTFYVRYKKPDGKMTTRSLETKDPEIAEQKFQEFKLTKGYLARTTDLTLSEMYNTFFNLYTSGGRNAKKELVHLKFLMDYLGKDTKCDNITKLQIEQYKMYRINCKRVAWNRKTKQNQETDRLVTPTTVNIALKTLKALFNKAINLNMLKNNPFVGIKLLQVIRQKKKTVNEQEMFQLLTSASNRKIWNKGLTEPGLFENRNMKNIFLFAYLSGWRLDSILDLEWSAVDFKNQIMHIVNKLDDKTNAVIFKSKTNENLESPITPDLNSLLLEQKQHNKAVKYVFGYIDRFGTEKRYNKHYVSRFFKKLCKENNIDAKIHFHNLRNTYINSLVRKGVNAFTIKMLAHHKRIETTQIYIENNTEDLRPAANLITFPKAQ